MILLENLAITLRVFKCKRVYLSQFVAGIEETPVDFKILHKILQCNPVIPLQQHALFSPPNLIKTTITLSPPNAVPNPSTW
jgi:hypothetical protein